MNKKDTDRLNLIDNFLINTVYFKFHTSLHTELGCAIRYSRFLVFFYLVTKYKGLGIRISDLPYKGIYSYSTIQSYATKLKHLGYLKKVSGHRWILDEGIRVLITTRINNTEVELIKLRLYFSSQYRE